MPPLWLGLKKKERTKELFFEEQFLPASTRCNLCLPAESLLKTHTGNAGGRREITDPDSTRDALRCQKSSLHNNPGRNNGSQISSAPPPPSL
ncbi:hypothetical protein CDAR_215791 [Caerostris darwini]|uniref:Uncharacterized protein n=1 Tax=Caerostris darwini TaxID=1538125 RepID=A0AAV4M660_9ARAC|nr:hypothetical protein CDAR_215791 [Caerostris darwini]